MANAETTFQDRLQRARSLQQAVAAFVPTFKPPREKLTVATFGTFLDGIAAMQTGLQATDWFALWEIHDVGPSIVHDENFCR
ncbi:MAG: hypothetical protein ACOYMN_10855 [Roseimicrobium sp.]